MKIPIYHHKYHCWKCNKEIEIYYPEIYAYKNNLPNVQKVFSKTTRSETIGNICKHCGNYQGNWFIDDYMLEAIYDDDFLESLLWIESPEKCNECHELIDYNIDEDKSTIWEFFSGHYGSLCLSCINYEKTQELIRELKESFVCTVCNRYILNTNFEDFSGYIIDDDTVVFSIPQNHHISYDEDKTIPVCKECHAKIHNSNDPEYTRYKPNDTRKDLPDARTYMFIPCAGGCGKNARVLKDEYDPNKAYSCYKCNMEAERFNNKMKQKRENKNRRQIYIDWWRKHG